MREFKKCVLSDMASDASDLSTFQRQICLRYRCFYVITPISYCKRVSERECFIGRARSNDNLDAFETQ